ncbi:MAG: hypothetical protein ABI665_26020 [Vicinamibacterales bacterium]
MHAIDDSVSHHDDDADHDRSMLLDHGDHRTARTLVQTYDSVAAFVLSVAVASLAISADEPVSQGIRQPNRAALLPTHDPPLKFTSSPAPPAIV